MKLEKVIAKEIIEKIDEEIINELYGNTSNIIKTKIKRNSKIMKPIYIDNSWNTKDCLDGKALEAGENLEIEWPDGTISQDTIFVNSRTEKHHCQGADEEHITSQAFVHRYINGATVLVRLTDQFKAKRI